LANRPRRDRRGKKKETFPPTDGWREGSNGGRRILRAASLMQGTSARFLRPPDRRDLDHKLTGPRGEEREDVGQSCHKGRAVSGGSRRTLGAIGRPRD